MACKKAVWKVNDKAAELVSSEEIVLAAYWDDFLVDALVEKLARRDYYLAV